MIKPNRNMWACVSNRYNEVARWSIAYRKRESKRLFCDGKDDWDEYKDKWRCVRVNITYQEITPTK